MCCIACSRTVKTVPKQTFSICKRACWIKQAMLPPTFSLVETLLVSVLAQCTYTLYSRCFSWEACCQGTCTVLVVIKVCYFLTQKTQQHFQYSIKTHAEQWAFLTLLSQKWNIANSSPCPWFSGLMCFLSHSACWAWLADNLRWTAFKSSRGCGFSLGWTNGGYAMRLTSQPATEGLAVIGITLRNKSA